MRAALLAGLAFVGGAASAQDVSQPQIDAPRWRLYAVEHARSEGVPARRLIEGAEGRVEMSWYFFVAVGHERVVLIDTGTDAFVDARAGRRRAWRVVRAIGVVDALARLGLAPERVTDVVLTHHHWDHVEGLPHFGRATVHVHPGEWQRVPARLRAPVERAGRLNAVRDAAEIAAGLSVREAGRHTAHQLMIEVACASGPVVIASDAAYLYRNIEDRTPVAVTASATRNVADVQAAARRVGAGRVLPGHDPALFERHASSTEGVAAICR